MKIRFAALAAAAIAAATPAMADLVFPSLSYRTGPYAPNGIPYADGFADYMTLLNERDGGINGVKIKIVRDSSLVGRQFLGYTHPHAKIVELYPEAFSSVETLVKTLGHEYTHVYQIRTLGKPTSSAQLGAFEKAAYEVEETFWRYFQLHKTRGE